MDSQVAANISKSSAYTIASHTNKNTHKRTCNRRNLHRGAAISHKHFSTQFVTMVEYKYYSSWGTPTSTSLKVNIYAQLKIWHLKNQRWSVVPRKIETEENINNE